MKTRIILLLTTVLFLFVSCMQPLIAGLSVSKEKNIQDGDKIIELFKLTNANGMVVKVTNYAASLTYVSAPDKDGHF